MIDYLRIIKALGGNVHSGMCFCPAHNNTNTPALHVSNRDGKVLLKCHAGCSQEAVIDALRAKGLWRESPKSPPRQPCQNEEEEAREQRTKRAKAAKEAKARWRAAENAPSDHPYCVRKGVRPDGLRMEPWRNDANPLLVPMYDEEGKLRNVHFIHANGEKHSIRGGQQKDAHYWIKTPKGVENKTILVCEGWATGKSAFDATEYAVIVTFGKANLLSVSKGVRGKYPEHKIILLADEDGGDGVAKANEAARGVNGLVAVPQFGDKRSKGSKDFNDLHRLAGLDRVKRQIDAAIAPAEEEKEPDDKAKETQALTLVNLAPIALFRTEDQAGYADVVVKGHRETHRIKSTNFKRWLMHQYWVRTGQTASSEAVRQALEMIEAKALFDDGVAVREVLVRVGSQDGKIYLDLCDEQWRAIEVTQEGWHVVNDPPVRFRRAPGMLPLPEPQQGGSVGELRPFVNVSSDGDEKTISDKDFVLVVAWLLAAFRDGPFPIMKVWGEPGAAKSTMTEVLRGLVDPHRVTRRRLPKEDRDLFIAANNAWVLTYDNLSAIPEWLSNSLCTIVTGGAFATRALYTDQDEQLFAAKRPVIINAVENFVTKHDLADRMILLELPFIPANERQRERDFKKKFEAKRPRILGALLDVVAQGLKNLPDVPEQDWPRMADFAYWIAACEPALWEPGTFRKAYGGNRKKATQSAIDDDLVATALRGFINEDQSEWTGTTTELLEALTKWVGEKQANSKDWPQNARALTGHLQKAKGALRRVGITIRTRGRTNKGRVMKITPNPDDARAPRRLRKDRHDTHDTHFAKNRKGVGRDDTRERGRDGRPGFGTSTARVHADTHDIDTKSSPYKALKFKVK